MCRHSEYNFKQRIRYSKKERKLYIDLMFDLNRFKVIDQSERNNIVVEKIVNEVPDIIAKYKFKDFDLQIFTSDLKEIFGQIK